MQIPARVPRRMVIYRRISDDREGRQNGVDRQDRQCRQLARKNGDEIVAVFTDDDRSAYSGKPRPDYIAMLAYLENGLADGAYALAPTRFYRRLDDGLEFFRLITDRKLEVETVKQGRYDLSTADGRRDALRAAVDAQHESEQISERVREAKADSLVKGEFRGGPRPFGYEADGVTPRALLCPSCGATQGFTVDRVCESCEAEAVNASGSEAWHVEQAIDCIIAGDSLRSLCRDLKAAGVRTVARRYKQPDGTRGEPESRDWAPTELRVMLLRPRNAGLIDHHGEIVGRAAWPPLVSEEKWRAAKAILENPERRTTTGNARVWMGAGIYRCHCGLVARGSTGGTGGVAKAARNAERAVELAASGADPGRLEKLKTRSWAAKYRCSSGKHFVREASELDKYVTRMAIARLSRLDAADLLLPPPAAEEAQEDLAATANALRAKLDGYTEDYDEDRITRQQMLDGTALTRKRLEKIEEKMTARARTSVLASLPLGTPEIAEQWPGYHLDKRRAIIAAIMTVTVHPARRGRRPGFKPGSGESYFDEETIAIEWKVAG
ncbi:recombinase family protein [Streptomyces sp. PH10-H1]|uniref:recombinase family protein n=1 Tax=Streptomyces sp. PH10-H1 TaxID=3046212 RepID=UPI0024B95FF7|nr:recombinase family protein [Streptomyces sp. PH10-H1]MDJ0341769.1 recombinase family protein [Streptomyces sp. PH10-H1]